jgi:hypothetical protein
MNPRSSDRAALTENGHVERLIGSIGRESLEPLVVFDEAQLPSVVSNYDFWHSAVSKSPDFN